MRLRPLPLLLALLAVPTALAQSWLAWPPASPVTEGAHPPRKAPAAAVRLRITQEGEKRVVWVDNDLSGPVEVRIDSTTPQPGLPLQRVLPARGPHRIWQRPDARALRLTLVAVPGVPGAHAQPVAYRFPLLLDDLRVGQPPQGRYSHADAENRHAIDFTAPVGTAVIAARAGTVMQAEARYRDAPGALDEANFVRILHGDGSMAVYAHLQRGSLQVLPGQRVDAGQVIARSGNSGYSSGPHLHFAVQVNAGLRLESVPARIVGDFGELQFPRGNDAAR